MIFDKSKYTSFIGTGLKGSDFDTNGKSTFPLVATDDIAYDDNTRLDEYLESLTTGTSCPTEDVGWANGNNISCYSFCLSRVRIRQGGRALLVITGRQGWNGYQSADTTIVQLSANHGSTLGATAYTLLGGDTHDSQHDHPHFEVVVAGITTDDVSESLYDIYIYVRDRSGNINGSTYTSYLYKYIGLEKITTELTLDYLNSIKSENTKNLYYTINSTDTSNSKAWEDNSVYKDYYKVYNQIIANADDMKSYIDQAVADIDLSAATFIPPTDFFNDPLLLKDWTLGSNTSYGSSTPDYYENARKIHSSFVSIYGESNLGDLTGVPEVEASQNLITIETPFAITGNNYNITMLLQVKTLACIGVLASYIEDSIEITIYDSSNKVLGSYSELIVVEGETSEQTYEIPVSISLGAVNSLSQLTISITHTMTTPGSQDGLSDYFHGESGDVVTDISLIRINNFDSTPDLSNYVTLNTAQTITGAKTFKQNVVAPAFYESSDERLKIFGEDINIDIDALLNIPLKEFVYKSIPDKTYIGTSAQEVEKVCPYVVSTDSMGFKSVDYSKLAFLSLIVLKQMDERLKKLEQKV